MVFVFLLFFCSVIIRVYGAKEGDYCIKEGAIGLCTNIRKCLDAQQDIIDKKRPQLCEFHSDPIVCCVSAVVITVETTKSPMDMCVLPPYPDHGTYTTNLANGKPGDQYNAISLNISCQMGYDFNGPKTIYCFNGAWSESMPECKILCRLLPHPSVEYKCLASEGGVVGTRICKEHEPDGTIVSPRCQTPNYYSSTSLKFMRCVGGVWDYVAICNPECGTVTPDGTPLVLGGEKAKRGEVPWHAGIYDKTMMPYTQICGGSLISSSVIVSAAHCYWNDVTRKKSASNYAVAVGKLYRPWTSSDETDDVQRSDVKEIHIPLRFQGSAANFQDDIAIIIVKEAFTYKTHIRPVCVDFDISFEKRQLQAEKKGKVAGWGLTAENGSASPVLNVIDLPFITIDKCITETPAAFREYITSDKICAGYKDGGKALCKGDTGGGLAFPEFDRGVTRYYLRGVVSVGPINENLCNAYAYTGFTQISKHEHFIKQFWGTN